MAIKESECDKNECGNGCPHIDHLKSYDFLATLLFFFLLTLFYYLTLFSPDPEVGLSLSQYGMNYYFLL